MVPSANRRRRPVPNFVSGQKVWLLRRNISTTRPSSKLDVRRLGPFAIIGHIGSSAFHLNLPPFMQIHHIYHVSRPEPYVPNTFPGRVVVIPPPLHVDGLPKFEVQFVLDSKIRRRKLYYFVDWVGYDVFERSW